MLVTLKVNTEGRTPDSLPRVLGEKHTRTVARFFCWRSVLCLHKGSLDIEVCVISLFVSLAQRASSRGCPTVQFGVTVVDGIVESRLMWRSFAAMCMAALLASGGAAAGGACFLPVRGGEGGMKGKQVEFWGGALE